MRACTLCQFNHVQLFSTPWTVARLTSLSMGFSRQEYWSGLPCLPPGELPDPGIEPVSPALAGRFFTTEPPGDPVEVGDSPINCGGAGALTVGGHKQGLRAVPPPGEHLRFKR